MAHIYFPNHAANAASTHASRRQLQDEQRGRKAASFMINPCELILVRHGETAWNKEGRLQGQQEPGPPLNDLGFQQAALAAQVLQQRYPTVTAVFSSDLLRAVQTAEVVAAAYQMQVQQHKGLRERNMGALQGLSYVEAPHAQPEAWAALQSDDPSTELPGGESLDTLRERLTAAVLDIAAQYPGGRVVVISHGGALHSLHRAARGYQAKGKVFNCSVSVLMAEADAAACSDREQHQHQHQHPPQQHGQDHVAAAPAAGNEAPHLDPNNPAAVGVKVTADADELAVVWCDSTDPCAHCSSTISSTGLGNSAEAEDSQGAAHVTPPSSSSADAPPSAAASVAPPLPHHQHSTKNSSSSSKGASSNVKRCGGGRVKGGRLALLSWNDGYALEAAHLQSDKAFGGSSRAG